MFGFGMRHHGAQCEERWAAGRHGRWRHRHGHHGDRHGMGGDDMHRAGRMLAQGDLRLIALALIAEQPRHGYEIIKVLEEKTSGWYSPSPGIVYPTLTYLEDVGYVTVQAEGSKKLYTITAEGRSHLDDNRDFVDAVMERFASIGERMARRRNRFRDDAEDRNESLPRSVQGAIQDLSETVRALLGEDREAKSRVIETIDRATTELRRK